MEKRELSVVSPIIRNESFLCLLEGIQKKCIDKERSLVRYIVPPKKFEIYFIQIPLEKSVTKVDEKSRINDFTSIIQERVYSKSLHGLTDLMFHIIDLFNNKHTIGAVIEESYSKKKPVLRKFLKQLHIDAEACFLQQIKRQKCYIPLFNFPSNVKYHFDTDDLQDPFASYVNIRYDPFILKGICKIYVNVNGCKHREMDLQFLDDSDSDSEKNKDPCSYSCAKEGICVNCEPKPDLV